MLCFQLSLDMFRNIYIAMNELVQVGKLSLATCFFLLRMPGLNGDMYPYTSTLIIYSIREEISATRYAFFALAFIRFETLMTHLYVASRS